MMTAFRCLQVKGGHSPRGRPPLLGVVQRRDKANPDTPAAQVYLEVLENVRTATIKPIIAAKVNHAGISTDTAAPVDDTSPQSPLAQKVAKLQTGLKEAEVVAILGPPTKIPFSPSSIWAPGSSGHPKS